MGVSVWDRRNGCWWEGLWGGEGAGWVSSGFGGGGGVGGCGGWGGGLGGEEEGDGKWRGEGERQREWAGREGESGGGMVVSSLEAILCAGVEEDCFVGHGVGVGIAREGIGDLNSDETRVMNMLAL